MSNTKTTAEHLAAGMTLAQVWALPGVLTFDVISVRNPAIYQPDHISNHVASIGPVFSRPEAERIFREEFAADAATRPGRKLELVGR